MANLILSLPTTSVMPFLDWVNKNQAKGSAREVPYHLLNREATYGDASAAAENLIVQGDNLLALKALVPFYAGRVKCIFIDPPYNTQSAFEHYDDRLEHSQWLSMMYPRLMLLRELLAEDGSIWVTIDDNEAHYLKVLMDETFGRQNFAANCLWEKVYSERMDARGFSTSHDHVLVYQKSSKFSPNQLAKEQKASQFNFWDENLQKSYRRRSLRKEGSESRRQDRPSMWYPIPAPDGSQVWPIKPDGTEGRWRWKEENSLANKGDLDFVQKNGKWEIYVKQYLEDNPTRPPATLWLNQDVGHNHEAKLEVLAFNNADVFDTPKPERLLQRVIEIATNAGDLVLDSFLGSGTTAAVAQKMGRRYVGIELGEHARTHCIPRLEKVIAGEQGGISESVGWQGGGGFSFLTLGEPAFDESGRINPAVKFSTLAAYIWQFETGTAGQQPFDSPFLGMHDGRAYFLLYNGILGDRRPASGNVLNNASLAHIRTLCPSPTPVVVYGETARLGPVRLADEAITFRQIPYDISMR
ncbi:site-specific DNA-methyltransferase [Burkholderia pseudomallei]|uniref:site-specific DNA-methyltransferase n=1 Tax=Burkholderia pseudomallei TaxID=28450 RepID=UPI0021807ABB|nr:site-specific DNA-methyltransferase [Burkholderia pseudomallei]